MFCRKCGKRIGDDRSVCADCEAAERVPSSALKGKLFGSLVGKAKEQPNNSSKPSVEGMWHTPVSLTENNSRIFNRRSSDAWEPAGTRNLPAHSKSFSGVAANRYNRSPRFKKGIREKVIEIQHPPTASSKPEFNWLTILLPPILMAAILVVVSIVSGGASTYLYFMIPMQIISVVVSVINYLQQKKKHGAMIAHREEVYESYLSGIQKELAAAADNQKNALIQENPSAQDCFQIALQRKKNLWERRFEDSDFGAFRLGVGSIPAAVTASWTKNMLSMTEDPLEANGEVLGASGRFIKDSPVITGTNSRVFGIVGSSEQSSRLAQQAVIQLAALHSYEDLKLGVVISDADRRSWDWVRWLPHTHIDDDGLRLLASTQSQASMLREKLLALLQERAEKAKHGGFRVSAADPMYLLIVAAPEIFNGNAIFDWLSFPSDLGVHIVFLCRAVSQLPKECSAIVELDNGGGVYYQRDHSDNKQAFVMDRCDYTSCDSFARSLAPLQLSEAAEKHTIPNSVTFFEGYKLKNIEDYNLGAAWDNARTDISLAAPIGVDETGKTFSFDILDGKHGVHGLVGGMPGSGKSEMLQSWILSMAMNYSPQDVSFILIDFKGTGLITPFVDLPHLAGTISNIDTDIKRNKEALEYELTRREKLFDKYGVSNIQAYLKKCNSGKIKERLPILFVIIDEFAEFKKTFPEFMKWVESSFAKGRSEGVWFILATQQPGNEASQAIKENSHFKWCLKVASTSASKDMIGIPDAAQITRPGRAYIKVNNSSSDFLLQVQSFWSGAPYAAGKDYSANNSKIATVDFSGNRQYFANSSGGSSNGATEISVAVAYIAQYVKKNHIPCAAKVWSDPLPARLAVDELLKDGYNGNDWTPCENTLAVTIGMVDDPKQQLQYPLKMRFTEQGHHAIYGAPVTGKTTLLKTVVMSAALAYSPKDLNVYIMDFGGMNMRSLAGLPHVGGITEQDETDKIQKLSKMLSDEIAHRKQLFATAGVGSIQAYRQEVSSSLPFVILVVDQINNAFASGLELDQFFLSLTQSGANYGIYLVASTTGVTGINYKMQANIKMAYALQMADKSDYSGIVGKTNGLIPEDIPGRGLVKGNPALLFQAALPASGESDGDINRRIREIAQEMTAAWSGPAARPIPQMPEEIFYDSITAPDIVCGLDSESIEPVIYDYRRQYYLLISGTPQSGKSQMLSMLGRQMLDKLGGSLHILDVSSSISDDLLSRASSHASTTDEIHKFFDRLMPILQERNTQLKEKRTEFSPIIVLIDDFSKFYSAVNDKTVSRLEAISKLCEGLGLYLLAAGDATELSVFRSKGEPFIFAASTNKQLLLLGGCLNDHGIAQLKLSFSEKSVVVNPGEGFFVDRQSAHRFKAMRDQSIRR